MLPIFPIHLRGIHARPTDVPESATSCTVHAALNVDTGTKKKCNNSQILGFKSNIFSKVDVPGLALSIVGSFLRRKGVLGRYLDFYQKRNFPKWSLYHFLF